MGMAYIFHTPEALAQTEASEKNALPEETIHLISSEDLLVSGSDLFYQVAVLNAAADSLSQLSQSIHVGLYNSEGDRVLEQKLMLQKGVASGKIFIRPSWSSGAYYLVAVTHWSMNNKTHLPYAKDDLLILNPFQRRAQNASRNTIKVKFEQKDDFAPIEVETEVGEVNVRTDSDTYGTREEVEIQIEPVAASPYPFSISVTKLKPLEVIRGERSQIHLDSGNYPVAEIRGSLIQGRIASNGSRGAVANKTIALTIPGKNYVFKLGKTDSRGDFYFSLEQGEFSQEEVKIYVVGAPGDAYDITLSKPILDQIRPKEKPFQLEIDPALEHWLESKSTANQIENAYYEIKSDSVLAPQIKKPFYAPLGIVYDLDAYTRFPTVRETFIEIITRAALREENGQYIFKTYNYKAGEEMAGIEGLQPLILIDGVMITDPAELVNYEAHNIDRITVVPDNYRYGPEIFSGIIDVSTKNGNFGKNIISANQSFLYPISEEISYQPDYSRRSSLAHIPDYRTQLYWEPRIDLQGKNSIKRSFYTSDVEGWYKVVLKGLDRNRQEVEKVSYFLVQ